MYSIIFDSILFTSESHGTRHARDFQGKFLTDSEDQPPPYRRPQETRTRCPARTHVKLYTTPGVVKPTYHGTEKQKYHRFGLRGIFEKLRKGQPICREGVGRCGRYAVLQALSAIARVATTHIHAKARVVIPRSFRQPLRLSTSQCRLVGSQQIHPLA